MLPMCVDRMRGRSASGLPDERCRVRYIIIGMNVCRNAFLTDRGWRLHLAGSERAGSGWGAWRGHHLLSGVCTAGTGLQAWDGQLLENLVVASGHAACSDHISCSMLGLGYS